MATLRFRYILVYFTTRDVVNYGLIRDFPHRDALKYTSVLFFLHSGSQKESRRHVPLRMLKESEIRGEVEGAIIIYYSAICRRGRGGGLLLPGIQEDVACAAHQGQKQLVQHIAVAVAVAVARLRLTTTALIVL